MRVCDVSRTQTRIPPWNDLGLATLCIGGQPMCTTEVNSSQQQFKQLNPRRPGGEMMLEESGGMLEWLMWVFSQLLPSVPHAPQLCTI